MAKLGKRPISCALLFSWELAVHWCRSRMRAPKRPPCRWNPRRFRSMSSSFQD
jgi:hypothetical protein